jgi:hypothetical protein
MILSISAPSSVRAQDGGQHDHDIAIRHQQITRGNIAMRDERFNRLS